MDRRDEQVADLDRYGVESRYAHCLDPWKFVLKYAPDSIKQLEPFCSEFLIHAADNEGLQRGIDEELVERLGQWCSIPVTYAGGGKTLDDLGKVKQISHGRVDLTIGSALDIFGGQGVKFKDCIEWNNLNAGAPC
jgi:phosphoribosylformimino-5-aminoimidazole carboxamide ribotide isomerase